VLDDQGGRKSSLRFRGVDVPGKKKTRVTALKRIRKEKSGRVGKAEKEEKDISDPPHSSRAERGGRGRSTEVLDGKGGLRPRGRQRP